MGSSKFLVLFALASVVVAASANAVPAGAKWYERGTPGFNYDCSGKDDGNYPHPTKCTHYVACVAQTEAYEMPCADNLDGTLLHYVQNSGPDPTKSRCDYPEVAGCQGPTPTEEPEEPETPEPTAEPTTTPAPGDPCNPEECVLKGDCRAYFTCNKETSQWEEATCGTDLFWNEAANNGSVHGGNCDFFQNLDSSLQAKYRGDESCILPCAFWQTQECTGNYNYRIPFDNRTLLNRELALSCPTSDEGEALVWVQSTLTCQRCADATDASGSPCPCP